MTRWVVAAGFAMTLSVSGTAFSQENKHVLYQNFLLQPGREAEYQKYCDENVSADEKTYKADYSRCQVTRLFLMDIKKKVASAYPPLTEPKYLSGEPNKDGVSERDIVTEKLREILKATKALK